MLKKTYNIESQVHKQLAHGGYRVKVSLLDLGIYINGAVVFPPSPEHPEWAVYMPAQLAGRAIWKPVIEFNKKLPLWNEIYTSCTEAVELDVSFQKSKNEPEPSRLHHQDVVLTDISPEPIQLDDIPFD